MSKVRLVCMPPVVDRCTLSLYRRGGFSVTRLMGIAVLAEMPLAVLSYEGGNGIFVFKRTGCLEGVRDGCRIWMLCSESRRHKLPSLIKTSWNLIWSRVAVPSSDCLFPRRSR